MTNMKHRMTTNLLVCVALAWTLSAGGAVAEPAPAPFYAGGAAHVAPPAAGVAELSEEVGLLQAQIVQLKEEASRDRSPAAYGSAVERYKQIGKVCSTQLELLERAMDVAEGSKAQGELIDEYDRIQRERAHVTKLVSILSLR